MSDINTNRFPATVFEKEIVYKECRRNHAISLGKVAHDGCPEFLRRDGDENAEDAFLCACCDCHRSFHHQHIVYKPIPQTQTQTQTPNITTSVPAGPSQFRSMMMMPKRKKRVTYSLEMRNQLMRFADSIGWKPRKDNYEEIERFCSEIKMTRTMFIIWLSNNRHRAMQNAQAPQN